MSLYDLEYQSLINRVISNGITKTDRTNTGTISTFGEMVKFKLTNVAENTYSLPLLTTKRIHFKSVLTELLWFIRGDSNIQFLQDNNVTIWNEWVKDDNTIGPGYPTQWRKWQDGNNTFDQLATAIETIKTTPNSRRIIVNSWNVGKLSEMALVPCHFSFQFNVTQNGELDIMWNQRSVDVFLGLPFNIASYAILLIIVANITNLTPRMVIGSLGDTHIYTNHMNQIHQQLRNDVLMYNAPSLQVSRRLTNIDDVKLEDFKLIDYKSYGRIPAPVAV